MEKGHYRPEKMPSSAGYLFRETPQEPAAEPTKFLKYIRYGMFPAMIAASTAGITEGLHRNRKEAVVLGAIALLGSLSRTLHDSLELRKERNNLRDEVKSLYDNYVQPQEEDPNPDYTWGINNS